MVRWPALSVPDQPEPHPENVGPDVGTEDYDEPIQDHSEGEQAQGQEPEPDEDVDLLVDDVEREDAQHVVVLDVAGCPVLVERALRHSKEKDLRYLYNVFLGLAIIIYYKISTNI